MGFLSTNTLFTKLRHATLLQLLLTLLGQLPRLAVQRLCRIPCGKPLAFRPVFHKDRGYASSSRVPIDL